MKCLACGHNTLVEVTVPDGFGNIEVRCDNRNCRWEGMAGADGIAFDTPESDDSMTATFAPDCPAGGPHNFEFLSAADQEDDSGRRFTDRRACSECGASAPPVTNEIP